MRFRSIAAFALLPVTTVASIAEACTRTLFVAGEVVITGRNMDWKEDMGTNLWIFPAGINRDGACGEKSIRWTSKYGSVVAAGYDAGSADGLNEKGLAINILYLAESAYGESSPDKPLLSIAAWGQYVLDNFASVEEAVTALRDEPFHIVAPTLPNGAPSTLHLSISDSTGDSAIFEYIQGKLVIHHGREYTVMTNSPSYDQQLAINAYWDSIGGLKFLPGTSSAADRFARAKFLLDAVPRDIAENYIQGVPGKTFDNQALAQVLGVMRSVSVPLGITTPDQPNISSTIWRTAINHRDLTYYFDSATRPNVFWVDLKKIDLNVGAPVKKLELADGQLFAGEVSDHFVESDPFEFLPGN